MSNLAIAHRVQGETPWIGLPAIKVDPTRTVTEMLNDAHLADWNVRLRLVDTDARRDKETYEVLRNNPFDGGLDRLATCGERYVEVQNEEIAALADGITSGDVQANTMGAYNNGRNVFMVFSLGDNIVLDPNGQADEIGKFLTIETSHDGSSAIVAVTGNMRIACQNMLTSNRHAALSTFKMRHTQSVEGRMLDARKALGIAFKTSEAFEKEMQALIETDMTEGAFWDLVNTIYPKPEADVRGSVKKWENKTDTIMGLWNGETNANLEDSAYKAYNALNEHLMWYGGVRAGNVENALVRASGFDDATNKKNLGLYKATLLAAV